MPNQTPQIIVVGSHAPGIFVRVHRIPQAGETVMGWDFHEPIDGGKGSNQAIAAARLGVRTSFVGCLGQDRIGEEGARWMREAGIDLEHLVFSETTTTGIGFILLLDDGVPAMVTSMGANEELRDDIVENALEALESAQVLLTQFEIRPEVAIHAARVARNHGMVSIINPAPAADINIANLNAADILVPNETEARLLLGLEPDPEISLSDMAEQLLRSSNAGSVMITVGEQGVFAADESGTWHVEPPQVQVVDTSGAGDVFCSALAVGIVKGWSNKDAAEWACMVAALSVTKAGTIPAFPTINEVEKFV